MTSDCPLRLHVTPCPTTTNICNSLAWVDLSNPYANRPRGEPTSTLATSNCLQIYHHLHQTNYYYPPRAEASFWDIVPAKTPQCRRICVPMSAFGFAPWLPPTEKQNCAIHALRVMCMCVCESHHGSPLLGGWLVDKRTGKPTPPISSSFGRMTPDALAHTCAPLCYHNPRNIPPLPKPTPRPRPSNQRP